jgi:rod shape-determining protein MreD
MNTEILKSIAWALLLLTAQVLVLNNIHLFGFATPLLLVYIIIVMPANAPRWVSLTSAFLMGIISDMFSNTPGVAAASLTATAFLQPTLLKLMLSREAPENLTPAISTMGRTKFISFSLILVLLYCLMFFALEEFSFFHLTQWAQFVGGSTILTLMLLLTIENFR